MTIVGNLFPPAAALATAPILAHSLGVQARGEVAAAMAPYLLLTTVAALGIPEAVTYAIARRPNVAVRATMFGVLIVGLVGVLLVGVVGLLGNWLSDDAASTRKLIVLASFAIAPGLCLGVVRGTASGLNLWWLVGSERVVTSITRLAVVIFLSADSRLTPLAATLTLACSPLVGGLVYSFLPKALRNRLNEVDHSVEPLQMYRFAAKVWVGGMAGILLVRLDQTLMLPLTNSYQLGLYVVAVAVAEVPLILNSAVRDVTFVAEASVQSLVRLTSSARIAGSACVIACLVMATAVHWGIPALFGRDFAGAVPATLVLLLGVVVVTQGSVAAAGLSGRGHPGLRSLTLTGACVVNVVLVILIVPRHGAVGAAWATVVGNAVFSAGSLFWMKYLYQVPIRQFFGMRASDWQVLNLQLRRVIRRTVNAR